MKRITRKKLKRSLQCTLSLLLAALMLSGTAFASGGSAVTDLFDRMNKLVSATSKEELELRELYGDDWQKVAALQPGDSYIGEEAMYICHEEIYVDWERVYSREDLDPSDWGGEDRLLLMVNEDEKIYTGNDFANSCQEFDGAEDQMAMWYQEPDTTRTVASGITRDTTDSSTVEYVEEYVYPELYEFSKGAGYSYPDTFRTLGTMNAPYIRDAGLDVDNGNHQKFKIILSKDDGTPSGVALGYRITYEGLFDYGWSLDLKAVNECNGHTFYLENGKLAIFENIKGEDDLRLKTRGQYLYGVRYGGELKDIPSSDLIIYIGKKTTATRIETISLKLDDAEQNPEALENVYGGAIEFYHWEKITSSSQLPRDTGRVYRALLVWEDKYFLQGDDFRKKSGEDSMALYVNEEKNGSVAPSNVAETPEINLSKNEFYTLGGLGTPYLRYTGSSTDSDNDYCPYYTFQLAGMDDNPAGKWLCDGDNILDVTMHELLGSGRYGGLNVGVIVGVEGDDDNDAAPGKVKLFFNEAGGFDTRFVYSGNVLYGDDSGWDGSGQFTLYIGKPVVYPAIRQNYVVGEDQFMHISQNGAMFKNVTIAVSKGGVLSVESWFMNNGRIIVDGGTLIVQNASNPLGDEMADDTEDSVMMPFADIHPLVSGSLELRNGAELIILDGARAAFSNIKATTGSSVLNRGILLAETIDLHSSTLENQKNAAVLAGYDFREMSGFRIDDLVTGADGARMPQMVSRLQDDVGCITRRKYSSVHNDGWITYSTVRMSVRDDSVRQSGSGVYTKLRGDKVNNVLTE